MKNFGNLINLESVSTGMTNDGMTYPMLKDGGYDYGNGIHLDDIERNGDWMQALSEADKIRISWVMDDSKSDRAKRAADTRKLVQLTGEETA